MSYSDFTLKQAKDKLGLQIIEDRDLFSTIKEITISELLSATLKYNIPLAMAVGTEKARSELIIANILLEVRKILNNQISLFSGVIFSGEFVECGDSSPLSEPCGDESPHSTNSPVGLSGCHFRFNCANRQEIGVSRWEQWVLLMPLIWLVPKLNNVERGSPVVPVWTAGT